MRTRVDLPQADGLVPTPTTCDCVSIRIERYAWDPARMPSERAKVSPRVGIPQEDPAITPTCQGVSIGTKRYAPDRNRYAL